MKERYYRDEAELKRVVDPILDGKQLEELSRTTKKKARMALASLHFSLLARAFRPDIIKGGYRVSGVYPFDPYVVLDQVPGLATAGDGVAAKVYACVPEILERAK